MLRKLLGAQRTVADAPDVSGVIEPFSDQSSDMPEWMRVEQVGTHVYVGLAGEIDMASAPQFRLALLEVLSASTPPTAVQVDLNLVSFMDARGVAALAEGCDVASRVGVAFAVHNPQRAVRQMLDVVGLTEVLGVQPAAGAPATADLP